MYNTPMNTSYYTLDQNQARASTLIQRVAYLLCTALLVTAGGAYIGRDLSPMLALPLGIGTIVCVVALSFTRNIPGVNLLLLYVLSIMEGLMFGPLLSRIINGFALGGQIVSEAAGLTAIIIAGVGAYVWISNKDFGYLGKTLFWALLGMMALGVIGIFWHTLFATTQVYLIYELAIVAIFVGFTLYDFSNIKHRFGPEDYVMATVALYLDFINLFWAILQLLLMFTSGGGQRRN